MPRVRDVARIVAIGLFALVGANIATEMWASAVLCVVGVLLFSALFVAAPRVRPRTLQRLAWCVVLFASLLIPVSGLSEVPSRTYSFHYYVIVSFLAANLIGMRAGNFFGLTAMVFTAAAFSAEYFYSWGGLTPTVLFGKCLDVEIFILMGHFFAALSARTNDHHISTIQDQAAALEHASQVKSKFLANISHEMRTPLNGVMGSTELLRATQLTKEQRELIEALSSSGRALARQIEDALDLSALESGGMSLAPEETDPNQSIDKLFSVFGKLAAKRGHTLVKDVAPNVPKRVLIDRYRCGRVFANLVENAIKFGENGEITIGVRLAETQPANPKLVRLRLWVSDTGPGIAEENLQHIFEPFYLVDASHSRRTGGAGLGLPIAKANVEGLGGTLHVRSQLGKGSTFWFELDLERAEKAPHAERKHDFSGKRVLLAEDNVVNQRIAVGMLARLGVEADVVADGAQAVHLFELEGARFDAILMDCQMPNLDGFEATRRIRALSPTVPIIAVTAHAQPGDTQECARAGMNGHLTKPFTLQQLSSMIGDHLPNA